MVTHTECLSVDLGELENIDFLAEAGDALFILTVSPLAYPCIFKRKEVMEVIDTSLFYRFLASFCVLARCCLAHLCESLFSEKVNLYLIPLLCYPLSYLMLHSCRIHSLYDVLRRYSCFFRDFKFK